MIFLKSGPSIMNHFQDKCQTRIFKHKKATLKDWKGRDMLRPEKLEDQVQFLISTLLLRELRDPDLGFLTVTAVRMTADRGIAKVYYTVLGEADQQARTAHALTRATGFLRKHLAKRLKLKKAPELRFYPDETLESGNKLEGIFQELERERAARPVVEDEENTSGENA